MMKMMNFWKFALFDPFDCLAVSKFCLAPRSGQLHAASEKMKTLRFASGQA
jgi:hypothetical protein